MIRMLALMGALAACGPAAPAEITVANTAPKVAAAAPARSDRDEVATSILTRFVNDPNAMPDQGLLPKQGGVYVLLEIGGEAPSLLTAQALPAARRPFVAKRMKELQAEADRTSATVAFIRFYALTVSGTTASAGFGVDIVLPAKSKAVKMCCCSSLEQLVKRGDVWVRDDQKGIVRACD